MTQQELVKDIQRRLRNEMRLTEYDLNRIVSTMTQSITDATAKGEKVKLRYLGTFQAKKREARMQNIAGKGMTQIPEGYRVSFSPSQKFTDAVNGRRS